MLTLIWKKSRSTYQLQWNSAIISQQCRVFFLLKGVLLL
jgi:hypothetical protein